MNRKYAKGYRFEHRVKKYLEKKGYKVFRLAGSKPADLIAISTNKLYLIECRTHRKGIKKTIDKMNALAEETLAVPVIAFKEGNRKIKFYHILEGKYVKDIPDTNNLNQYLEK